MKITLKFQSSIHPGHFKKLKIIDLLDILKFPKTIWENYSGRGSCPSSSPSGNLVDGSPLVAIEQERAQVHLTCKCAC